MSSPSNLKSIGAALAAARRHFSRATKDSQNPHLRVRYASLTSVIEAVDEALDASGLTYTQPVVIGPTGPVLRTILIHCESGETLESECPLLFDGASKINQMQSLGSALTYARRYSLESLLGVLRDDDDGEAAYPREADHRHQAPPATRQAPPARPQPAPQRSAPPANGNGDSITAFLDWIESKVKATGAKNKYQLINRLYSHAVEDGLFEGGSTTPGEKARAILKWKREQAEIGDSETADNWIRTAVSLPTRVDEPAVQ